MEWDDKGRVKEERQGEKDDWSGSGRLARVEKEDGRVEGGLEKGGRSDQWGCQ